MTPILTIITVTYEAALVLPLTIKSIAEQDLEGVECVLVDGNSIDGTVQIAKESGIYDHIISEPDNGLYDAMNKGIKAAKGQYIWFMNAGDEIASDVSLLELLQLLKDHKPDVLYSDTHMYEGNRNYLGLRTKVTPHKLQHPLVWRDYNLGMKICHQSFISKKSISPFFMEDNLSADIDWEIQILKKAMHVMLFEGILANYFLGGLSNKRQWKSWTDRYLVLQKHFGFLPNLLAHFQIIIRGIWHQIK